MVQLTAASAPIAPPTAAPASPAAPRAAAAAFFEDLRRFTASAPAVARAAAFPWSTLARLLQTVRVMHEASSDLFWLAAGSADTDPGDYLATHHARVAIMATKLGANLDYEPEALEALGMAAAVVDLGLLGPARSPAADGLDVEHPGRGAEMIARWAPPHTAIVTAVLQHHERERGQGYPAQLTGDAIHPDAKIVGLVDQYTRLVSPPRPHRALAPHEAVRELLRSRRDAFPTAVIKALLVETSVFPPGTTVRLSTGTLAVVLEANRDQPLRPKVALLGAAREIDLRETPFVYIVDAAARDA